MKRNIFLFLSLAGLLTFTYFFEEVGGIKEREAIRVSKALFQDGDLGEINSITFPSAKLIRKGKIFYTSEKNLPVDPEKLQKVLDVLANIQSLSILKVDPAKVKRSHFFPSETYKFSFDLGNTKISYLLGKKLDYSQDFYMEVISGGEKRIIVARDTSVTMGIYDPKKIKWDAGKFERLKNIILLSEDAYYNLRPLKNFKGPAVSIKVENKRNRSFSLDLKKMNSTPMVLGRLKYDELAITNYLNWLKSFESETIHLKWKAADLKQQVARIELTSKSGDSTVLLLFSQWKKKKGYFLSVSGDKNLFQLSPRKIKKFYANVQDFWFKRPLPIKKGKEIELLFKDGKKISFKIVGGNRFKVVPTRGSKNLSQKSFHKLVTFLIGQAERVSKKGDGPYTFLNNLLSISLDDLTFTVYQEKDELLLVSEKDQTVFHYKVGRNFPIGVKTSDYFNHE
ncbi:MAG: hypothetical protein E2O68_08270 [Deltaproteobacteria bacterium]|nr:MAG: hypothetical protein E2O68_08270 [Deltaproteobacteria bacterium]